MSWQDFNDAAPPAFAPIPKGSVVKVRMTLRPGGYDDAGEGWTEGWATRSDSGAVYLNAEFVVVDGPYAHRKLWSLIGLHSPKGPTWAQMGRSFVRAALSSAFGLSSQDTSERAQQARRIDSFADLDGLVFVGLVDWDKDAHGEDKAIIRTPLTAEHPDFAAAMGTLGQRATPNTTAAASGMGRPSWAQ